MYEMQCRGESSLGVLAAQFACDVQNMVGDTPEQFQLVEESIELADRLNIPLEAAAAEILEGRGYLPPALASALNVEYAKRFPTDAMPANESEQILFLKKLALEAEGARPLSEVADQQVDQQVKDSILKLAHAEFERCVGVAAPSDIEALLRMQSELEPLIKSPMLSETADVDDTAWMPASLAPPPRPLYDACGLVRVKPPMLMAVTTPTPVDLSPLPKVVIDASTMLSSQDAFGESERLLSACCESGHCL